MLPLSFALLAVCFLAGPVSAGSRLWELPLHQIRGNATALEKRGFSIIPGSGTGDIRLWPDKTITYAFADSNSATLLKALFFEGQEVWNRLKVYGFSYNPVSTSKCKSDRTNCLMIYYNNKGYLSSSVAKPPAVATPGQEFEGPTMHLSDSWAVGNRNPIMNVAHEIGHAWGLLHEHQNEKHWKTSPEDQDTGHWTTTYTGTIFHTNKFNCKNLKDYAAKLIEVEKDSKDPETEKVRLCTSYTTANKYKFSAMEWLPLKSANKKADPRYDPDSLMLYPSRAGGDGSASENSDERKIVLSYEDGSEIPVRQGPSDWDITKLVDLYGTATKESSEPYNKKGGPLDNLFRKTRGSSSERAGDTKGGPC